MPRLDAIFFDIDDTLFPTTSFAERARRNAVRAMIAAGLDLPEEVVYKELKEVISEFTSNYGNHYGHLLKRLGPEALEHVNPALVIAAGVVAYHDTKFREIARLWQAVGREGVTLVPLKIYFNEKGVAKLSLGLAKGKKMQDKRETEKKRDWQRDKARLMRDRG